MIAILHADVARSDIGNHLGYEERIVFGTVLFVKSIVSGFFLECMQTADTSGNNNTDTVFVHGAFSLEIGVCHCLTGSYDGILGIEVELTQFLTVEMLGGVKILYFASELGLELGSIEMGNIAATTMTTLLTTALIPTGRFAWTMPKKLALAPHSMN